MGAPCHAPAPPSHPSPGRLRGQPRHPSPGRLRGQPRAPPLRDGSVPGCNSRAWYGTARAASGRCPYGQPLGPRLDAALLRSPGIPALAAYAASPALRLGFCTRLQQPHLVRNRARSRTHCVGAPCHAPAPPSRPSPGRLRGQPRHPSPGRVRGQPRAPLLYPAATAAPGTEPRAQPAAAARTGSLSDHGWTLRSCAAPASQPWPPRATRPAPGPVQHRGVLVGLRPTLRWNRSTPHSSSHRSAVNLTPPASHRPAAATARGFPSPLHPFLRSSTLPHHPGRPKKRLRIRQVASAREVNTSLTDTPDRDPPLAPAVPLKKSRYLLAHPGGSLPGGRRAAA